MIDTDVTEMPEIRLIEQMRRELRRQGETSYRIARATGIDRRIIAGFRNGHGYDNKTLGLQNAGRLLGYLGFRLRPPRHPVPTPRILRVGETRNQRKTWIR